MKLLQQFSVRGKLIFAFATVLLLMSLITLLSGVQGARIGERTEALIEVRLGGVRDSLLMAEAATRLRTRDFRVAMTGLDELPKVVERIKASKEEFDGFRRSYEAAIADEQERALFQKAMADWATYTQVSDKGVGIPDVKKAMEPLFTTKPEMERSGMGFSFMEAFMDELEVESEPGKGTTVKMRKEIGRGRELWTTQSL